MNITDEIHSVFQLILSNIEDPMIRQEIAERLDVILDLERDRTEILLVFSQMLHASGEHGLSDKIKRIVLDVK